MTNTDKIFAPITLPITLSVGRARASAIACSLATYSETLTEADEAYPVLAIEEVFRTLSWRLRSPAEVYLTGPEATLIEKAVAHIVFTVGGTIDDTLVLRDLGNAHEEAKAAQASTSLVAQFKRARDDARTAFGASRAGRAGRDAAVANSRLFHGATVDDATTAVIGAMSAEDDRVGPGGNRSHHVLHRLIPLMSILSTVRDLDSDLFVDDIRAAHLVHWHGSLFQPEHLDAARAIVANARADQGAAILYVYRDATGAAWRCTHEPVTTP
ncbi:MAG: hypothetical protein H0U69_03645 [Trueperaceae bacterium]|nr:hypothetical protein [Trueperaceae bacterium]